MVFFKIFSLFFLVVGAQCLNIAARNASNVAIYPLASLGNIAAIQFNAAGVVHTRLFYQEESGDIIIHAIANGPFTTGQTIQHRMIVPAAEVLRYTPIAATIIGDGTNGIHVYFLSPDRRLSEYRYTSPAGWRGGAGCPYCIDHAGFAVADDNVLYALEHPSSNVLRVGFISPGTPGTVSEAVTTNSGLSWQLAPLPDA